MIQEKAKACQRFSSGRRTHLLTAHGA